MVRLRRRTLDDCETVVRWIPDPEALYLFTGPRLAWPPAANQLAEMGTMPGFSAWIVTDGTGEAAIGHFDLVLDGSDAHIGRVIIAPASRGQGLSTELITLAMQQARSLGAARLVLNVIRGNVPAERTYERAGFVDADTSPRPDVRSMVLEL